VQWTEITGHPKGAVLTPETLWELAKRWYGNRLDYGWTRRPIDERQAIFDELGLIGEFWNLSVSNA
jgi:hypothetical protein